MEKYINNTVIIRLKNKYTMQNLILINDLYISGTDTKMTFLYTCKQITENNKDRTEKNIVQIITITSKNKCPAETLTLIGSLYISQSDKEFLICH